MYSLENTTDLTALGDAIRAKTGDSNEMTVAEMATAVAGITGGGGGEIKYKTWTNYSNSYSGYYAKKIARNSQQYWTVQNATPSTFYLIYQQALFSGSSFSRFDLVIAKYDNGTVSYITCGSTGTTYPAIKVGSVTQTGGNTVFYLVNDTSQDYGMWCGSYYQYLYFIYSE